MSGGLATTGVGLVSSRPGGFAMLELLVALLVFSIALLGLLSGQLAGKRLIHDALQRSVATTLARDLLERARANPAHVAEYRRGVVGAGNRQPVPAVDCDTTGCTGAELAAFDLWQWESRLFGAGGERGGTDGLLLPRACVTGADGTLAVAISWSGLSPAGPAPALPCATGGDDAESRPRHRLAIVTLVAGSP